MTAEKTEPKTAKKRTSSRPPRGRTSTGAAIKEAERALAARKIAHRAAFREACVKLFNQFGFALVADGDLSAHLKIEDLTSAPSGEQVVFLLSDIPE